MKERQPGETVVAGRRPRAGRDYDHIGKHSVAAMTDLGVVSACVAGQGVVRRGGCGAGLPSLGSYPHI